MHSFGPSIMKSLHFLAFVFFILLSSTVDSQDPDAASVKELNNSFHKAYGPDQNLVCGLRYIPDHMPYEGHKFFREDTFVRGKLFLEKGIYPGVFLKYDLFGQQLILKVFDNGDNYDEIIVTDSRLKGFELEGRTFRKLYFPETDTLIFQVIGQGDPVCLYHWEKEFIQNPLDHDHFFKFSEMMRKSYVVTNSSLHRFKGARSFSKSFPDYREQIMQYIRREKISISKAEDAEIRGLINYCSKLLKEDASPENIPAGLVPAICTISRVFSLHPVAIIRAFALT